MLTQEEMLKIFEKTGGILKGHFILVLTYLFSLIIFSLLLVFQRIRLYPRRFLKRIFPNLLQYYSLP